MPKVMKSSAAVLAQDAVAAMLKAGFEKAALAESMGESLRFVEAASRGEARLTPQHRDALKTLTGVAVGVWALRNYQDADMTPDQRACLEEAMALVTRFDAVADQVAADAAARNGVAASKRCGEVPAKKRGPVGVKRRNVRIRKAS